ncbi:RNA-binding protein 44 [Diretmus argenteus]
MPTLLYNVRGIVSLPVGAVHVAPRLFRNPVIEEPGPIFSTEDVRTFLLNRSVFDLVKAFRILELTDPKLLGWYLSLPLEDRKLIQDEGGFHQFLRRHPALELSSQHVQIKYGDLDLSFIPDHVRQNLNLLVGNEDGNSNNGAKCQGTQTQPGEEQQLVNLQDSFQTAYDSSHGPLLSQLMEEGPSWQKHSGSSSASVYKDPSAHASFSLDMELERHRQEGKPNSNCPAIDQETPPEYYSLDSIQMDCTECCDTSIIQSGKSEHDDPLLATKGSSELLSTGETPPGSAEDTEDGCYDYRFYHAHCNDSEGDCSANMTSREEASSSCDEQNENFHSIMEDDKSILSKSNERLEPCVSGVGSAPITMSSKALVVNSETLEGDPSSVKMIAVKQATAESSGGTVREDCGAEGCGCVQRAQRAELHLLALQYSMCRQHCWRRYYTSAEGDPLTLMQGDINQYRPEGPPANIVSVLQRLDVDYNEMRDKILAGVALEQLKPLTVDSQQMTTETHYIPEQVRITAAECKEVNSSEMWYDAEENLETAAVAEMEEAASVMAQEKDESASEAEQAKSSYLCVTDLHSNVTEGDVLLWFEKYHASEVSISTVSNGLRVAVVTVSDPQSAEAAVRELVGCSMQGHDLHVEHIYRPSAGSQASSSTKRPGVSGDAPNPQTTKTNSSNTAVKLMPQQLLCSSLEKRTVICTSPTPKGTCVPLHYATMGGFETLMSQLTQRHPGVGRQTIMDALLELRAKHRGILIGLHLSTIVEMMSELLTRPRSTSLS